MSSAAAEPRRVPGHYGPRNELAPHGSACVVCGREAGAKCDTCDDTCCGPHWWKHSHPRPAAEPKRICILEVPPLAKGEWIAFGPRELCPVCGHAGGWCTVAPDGDAIQCKRVQSGKPVNNKDGTVGWMHPIPDGPATVAAARLQPAKPPAPKRSPAEWALLVKRHRSALSPEKLERLSRTLGVSAESLRAFGVGWDDGASCWSFPMYDGRRQVIGIRLRIPNPTDGRRWICVRGSANGLFLPDDYSPRPGDPLLMPEGPTDAAAARDMGLRSAGRANSSGGTDLCVGLLGEGHAKQDVVVVGENDGPKWAMVPDPPPPFFPGFEGAVKCCRAVLPACGRLRCIVPPRPWKDLRQWRTEGGAKLGDVMALVDAARPVSPLWLDRADARLDERRQQAVATARRMTDRIVWHEERGEGGRALRIREWLRRRGYPLDVRRERAA